MVMPFQRTTAWAEPRMAAGRRQGYLHPIALGYLPVRQRLDRRGEALAIAHRHDVQRLGRGDHRPVAGAGVVGMAMGDDRPRHRP